MMLNTLYGMTMAMVGGVPRGGTLIYNAVDVFTCTSQQCIVTYYQEVPSIERYLLNFHLHTTYGLKMYM